MHLCVSELRQLSELPLSSESVGEEDGDIERD